MLLTHAGFKYTLRQSFRNLWNGLDCNARVTDSLASLILKVISLCSFILARWKYISPGRHSHIRNCFTNLNNNLFCNHLRHGSICNCGTENAEHYFIRYTQGNMHRRQLFLITIPYHSHKCSETTVWS